jgi:ADP-heptose:LPS heptosyltransferase
MPIFTNRHGVIRPGIPQSRVINMTSRKRQASNISLEKLFKLEQPVICVKRRLGGIGDVIMSTPALQAIKKTIPHCKLIYATDLQYANGALGDVIRHNPYVDELIGLDQLKESTYDYSVDITTTGLSKERSMQIPPNRIDMFAEAIGISVDDHPFPAYEVTEEEREVAREQIKELLNGRDKDKTNIITIQARSNDVRRTWPIPHVQELINLLSDKEDNLVLLCDWGHLTGTWSSKKNLALILNKTLPETAALVEQSDIVVCPDSAILHLAGALNKKTVSIFGPIPPESRINHYPNAVAIVHKVSCGPCVVGESKILTELGYREIQDIKEKDKVLTNSGKLEEVLTVHKNTRNERKLLEIETFGSYKPLVITEDHKLLISRRTLSWKKEDWFPGKRRGISKLSNPEWKEAKEVKAGDYCCFPIPQTIQPTNLLLQSKDLAWLVGLFVAEGWTSVPTKTTRRYMTTLAISNKEKDIEEKVQKIITEHPYIFCSEHTNKGFFRIKPNPKGESNLIKISNKNLVSLLSSLFKIDGKINLSNKYIPAELIHAPNEIIEAFLNGLLKGDGYRDNKNDVFSTAKENLAYGIQMLFVKLRKVSKVYKRIRDTNYKKDSAIYRVYVSREEDWKRWYKEENHLLVPVKKIKESNRKDYDVWDISVANDPTFTVNNLSVFDCWYSPKCHKDNSHLYLECLTKITPQQVYDAVVKKIQSPDLVDKIISSGKTHSVANQDPIIMVRRDSTGIGDLLMATTGIEALKVKYPTKQIHVAVPKSIMSILENNPCIDQVVDIKTPVNSKRYFLIADITSPCARYESARVRANKLVEKNRVEIYAEALGVRELITNLKPKYHVSEQETLEAKEFFDKNKITKDKKTIAVVVESAEEYRSWPIEKVKELMKTLKETYNVVAISQQSTGIEGVVDIAGVTLRQMAAVVSLCDLVVTPDTGVLHFAAALEIPTIALFGPIDYRTRCKGYKNVTVIKTEMSCIPCWRNGVTKCKQTGLSQGYSKCLENIPVKQVVQVINKNFENKK